MYVAVARRVGVTTKQERRVTLADLREYHPWLRDRLAALIQGDDKSYSTRGKIAKAIVGSNGVSPSFGLADFTPAGIPLNAYDAGRHGAQGEYVNSILSGLNLVPGAMLSRVPGLVKKGAQVLTGGEDAAKIVPMINKPINKLAQPAIDSMSRRGFLGGVGAAGLAAAVPGGATKIATEAAPAAIDPIAAHMAMLQHNLKMTEVHSAPVDKFYSGEWDGNGIAPYQEAHDRAASIDPELAKEKPFDPQTDNFENDFLGYHEDKASEYLDAAHEHMDQLTELTGKTRAEIYKSLPDGPEKGHLLDYIPHGAPFSQADGSYLKATPGKLGGRFDPGRWVQFPDGKIGQISEFGHNSDGSNFLKVKIDPKTEVTTAMHKVTLLANHP